MFLAHVATHATGTLNSGLFMLTMSAGLGMSRSFVGWAQTACMLAGGLSSVLIGRLLDRCGPRLLIAEAPLVMGACVTGRASIEQPGERAARLPGFQSLKPR